MFNRSKESRKTRIGTIKQNLHTFLYETDSENAGFRDNAQKTWTINSTDDQNMLKHGYTLCWKTSQNSLRGTSERNWYAFFSKTDFENVSFRETARKDVDIWSI